MIKHGYYIGVFYIMAVVLTSCLSTGKEPEKQPSVPVPEIPVAVPEPAPVVKTPENEDEYARSTSALQQGSTITKDIFQEDKKQILDIIDQLAIIMKNVDYGKWRTYIEPDSLAYWNDPKKLHKAAERLPIKGISLGSLQDYFKFVFIPSRAGRVVDEIRYISDTSVKAVQVKGNTDIIYYNFVKIDGKWMLHLPPLES